MRWPGFVGARPLLTMIATTEADDAASSLDIIAYGRWDHHHRKMCIHCRLPLCSELRTVRAPPSLYCSLHHHHHCHNFPIIIDADRFSFFSSHTTPHHATQAKPASQATYFWFNE